MVLLLHIVQYHYLLSAPFLLIRVGVGLNSLSHFRLVISTFASVTSFVLSYRHSIDLGLGLEDDSLCIWVMLIFLVF